MVGILIGNYKITEEIAHGGMGKVFKAMHTSLERIVAVKMIHPQLLSNKQIVTNFYNEAKIQAKLNHPNIATIYDFFEHEEKHYVVMEYVEGESISRILKHVGAFDLDIAISIFKQILNGLIYAHSKNVIHKDIKTSNFLLTPNTVKIIDFGIAQILDGTSKNVFGDLLLGTPKYMSPEQIIGKNIDQRTDIYSLGIVLYEFLTGKVPFNINTDSDFESQLEKLNTNPLPVTQLNPKIPKIIEDIIFKAIEKEPANRFQTVEDMLNALEDKTYKLKNDTIKSHKSDYDSSGKLSENKAAEIFCSIYYKKTTGTLLINSNRELKIHFYKGYINFVEYDDSSLYLGEILIKNNKISEEERKDVLNFVHETGKQIGECLIKLNKITSHELNEILENQIKEKIKVGLLCFEGNYSFKSLSEPETENIYNINPLQIIYDLVREGFLNPSGIDIKNIDNEMSLSPTKKFDPEITKIKFSSLKEIKLSNLLRENKSLKEVLMNSPLDKKSSLNFLNFLYLCDLITVNKSDHSISYEKEFNYYQSLQEDTTVLMSKEEINEIVKK
ncbi:MAG: serine/threonine-protein kinase [Thermodesulfobacteriota bacterium]